MTLKVKKYTTIYLGVLLCIFILSLLIIKPRVVPDDEKASSDNSLAKELATAPPLVDKKWSLVAVGDIMLGRTVMTAANTSGDINYPFLNVAPILKDADLTFGNLESPIVENCPKIDSGFTFCTDPKLISGLVYSGFDVVTIANNHVFNFGKTGVDSTKETLTKNGISYVGLGSGTVKEIKGLKIGFVGLDFVSSQPSKSDWEIVKEYKQMSDFLIVGVHWGVEYTSGPTELQKQQAKELVSSGADLVIGSHPHWVQGKDEINGKVIYWSLGNFIFDQMWSEETKKGVIVRIMFDGTKIVKEELDHTYIPVRGQPELIK